MPQTAHPDMQNNTAKKPAPWKGKLNLSSWKEDGEQDKYLQSLVDNGTITPSSTWSDVKKLPEAHDKLGSFDLQFIRNKFKKYLGIAQAKRDVVEEKERVAKENKEANLPEQDFRPAPTAPIKKRPVSIDVDDTDDDDFVDDDDEDKARENQQLLAQLLQARKDLAEANKESVVEADSIEIAIDSGITRSGNLLTKKFVLGLTYLPPFVYLDEDLTPRCTVWILPPNGALEQRGIMGRFEMDLFNAGWKLRVSERLPTPFLCNGNKFVGMDRLPEMTAECWNRMLVAMDTAHKQALQQYESPDGWFYATTLISLPRKMEDVVGINNVGGNILVVHLIGELSQQARQKKRKVCNPYCATKSKKIC